MKHFVLIGTTRGDELIHSRQVVIAASVHKDRLTALSEARAKERQAYLANHEVPWWSEEAIYEKEEIQEVESV